jgi:sulfoxide reductase heme-binding subunit YedZ
MALNLRNKWLKVVAFVVCLIPAALLTWRALTGNAGPNPVETITHGTGDYALRFLLISLAITPLRRYLKLPDLIRFRRMLGLFAFFYGFLHLTIWFALDKGFETSEMIADVIKRPFITAGMTSLLLMLPLAVTSTAGWIRRLGGKRWRTLHRIVYISAAAAVIHYYWLVKSDVREPLLYGSILAVLLAARLPFSGSPLKLHRSPPVESLRQ